MKVTEYTMDPRNAPVVRFLQSRPIQIGSTGFLISVANFLDTAGYLSRTQREALEGIIKKNKWEMPDALPPAVDDCGERVIVYVTPGQHPGNDCMEALAAKYRPLGKTGVRIMHDPVYMTILDPGNVMTGLHRLRTSCGTFPIAGTGWGAGADKREEPESAKVLNASVAPLLSTPDSDYRFRNAKVTGRNSSGWWVFAERHHKDLAPAGAAWLDANITAS